MHKNLYAIALSLGLALTPALLVAQNGGSQSYSLLFRTGQVTPEANALAARDSKPANSEVVHGYYFRILQFWQIPTQEQKEIIQRTGVQLHQYFPNNAYFASVPVNTDLQGLANLGLRAILPVDAAQKLSPDLFNRNFPAWAMQGTSHIDLVVQYYPTLTPAEAEKLLVSGQPQVQVLGRYDFSHQITVRVNINHLAQLAQLPFISYLEPIDPPAEPENLSGRTSHRSNAIATETVMGRHYNGEGVYIALGDDGIIGPHIDYQGRADQTNVTDNDGDHGDHVAGIIMGAGNRDPRTRGMAFGASLEVYDVWDAINTTPVSYITPGVRITSLSYGNGCNAGYTSFARTADQQIRQMPSLMHVFSAGNSGTTNCGYGAGNNWGNITGGIKAGKNVLAVANVNSTDVISTSSSRGPAHDGRIKPDISAVGSNVYSTVDVNAYETKSGTSMACPGVSGTLAQLYQAYRDLNNGADPDAGLIKAVVLNTADDLGNAGPDFTYGFGRINALRAVRTLEDQTYLTAVATQGATQTHQLTVPAGTKEMRVMVYWTDFEGASNAAVALVNNLNMQMTAPTGTTYNPWVLNHAPVASTLNAPATRAVDNLNNVEQITLANPDVGTYTISINGAAVPEGPQTYYLVYTYVTDQPELTYPIGGEALVPGVMEIIRWDAYGNSGTFALSYSVDSGATWVPIANSVAATARHYLWNVPSGLLTGQAMVKISRGTLSDTSDEVFTIINTPTGITFPFICPDSMMIQWNAVPGAVGYEVSRLGARYMDSVATVTGNSAVLYGVPVNQEEWFSVKALAPDNGRGRRAIAVSKPQGVLNCSAPDVALFAITSPVSGCFNGANTDLCITIQNVGPAAVTDLQAAVSVNSGMPALVTVPGLVPAGGILNYCFPSGLFSIPASGPVQISVAIISAADGNPANNSLSINPVLVNPPVAAISYTNTGSQYSFAAIPAGMSYFWDFGDGSTSTAANPDHTYPADTTYLVSLVVTDGSGCSDTTWQTISVLTGLRADLSSGVTVFPNPSSGNLAVNWVNAGTEVFALEVLNTLGQVVHRQPALKNSHTLHLGSLADGSYLLKLVSGTQTHYSRFVLQR